MTENSQNETFFYNPSECEWMKTFNECKPLFNWAGIRLTKCCFGKNPTKDQKFEKSNAKLMGWMIEIINLQWISLLIRLWKNEKVKKIALVLCSTLYSNFLFKLRVRDVSTRNSTLLHLEYTLTLFTGITFWSYKYKNNSSVLAPICW